MMCFLYLMQSFLSIIAPTKVHYIDLFLFLGTWGQKGKEKKKEDEDFGHGCLRNVAKIMGVV